MILSPSFSPWYQRGWYPYNLFGVTFNFHLTFAPHISLLTRSLHSRYNYFLETLKTCGIPPFLAFCRSPLDLGRPLYLYIPRLVGPLLPNDVISFRWYSGARWHFCLSLTTSKSITLCEYADSVLFHWVCSDPSHVLLLFLLPPKICTHDLGKR